MSETTNDVAPDTGTETTETVETEDTTDWKAEAEKFRTLHRKQEERAKANATAAKELDQLRQQTMTDVEKARAEGRTEAIREASTKVAKASLRAAAAGRVELTDDVLEGLNLAAFVDETGEVDEDKVTRFVDGIAPKPAETQEPAFPDLGQGARGNGALALNGDPLQRDLERKLGIR